MSARLFSTMSCMRPAKLHGVSSCTRNPCQKLSPCGFMVCNGSNMLLLSWQLTSFTFWKGLQWSGNTLGNRSEIVVHTPLYAFHSNHWNQHGSVQLNNMSSLQILIAWPHHVSTIFSIQCLFGQVSNFSWSELVSVLLTDVNLALAVHFFPRICCLYFIFWHMYFYSCPYGYMDVALIPLFCFMMVSSKAVHCVCLRDKSDACNFGISMPCCIPYWPLRPQIVLEASSMWRTRERVSKFNCM